MESRQFGQVSLANAEKMDKAIVAIEDTITLKSKLLPSRETRLVSLETRLERIKAVSFEMLFPHLCSFRSNRSVNVHDHFSLRLTDRLPTGRRLSATSRPTVGQFGLTRNNDSRPIVGRQSHREPSQPLRI